MFSKADGHATLALEHEQPADAVIRLVVTHLAKARRAQILARFAAGDAVHTLRYGANASQAMDQLASALSLDRSGLARIGRTSERIRPAERAVLVALTDECGLPLTWSHLEVLSKLRMTSKRLRLARLTLARGLSVRQLKRVIAEETVSGSTDRARMGLDCEFPPK